MLLRALSFGTILAISTGTAVYFMLGAIDDNSVPVSSPADAQLQINDQAVHSDEGEQGGVSVERAAKPPLKNSQTDLEITKQAEGAPIPNHGLKDESANFPLPASSKVKLTMNPSATSSFIVDTAASKINDDGMELGVKSADAAKAVAAENPASGTEAADVNFRENLKSARMITNKSTRDKIYLEILEDAIADGHIDAARNISRKLSTPELRRLAKDAVSRAMLAIQ